MIRGIKDVVGPVIQYSTKKSLLLPFNMLLRDPSHHSVCNFNSNSVSMARITLSIITEGTATEPTAIQNQFQH